MIFLVQSEGRFNFAVPKKQLWVPYAAKSSAGGQFRVN
jgi:hypothetical protein